LRDRPGASGGAGIADFVIEQEDSSFSEEKEAKRLLFLRCSHDRGHGLDLAAGARNKSLLVLFFRKEQLPYFGGFRWN
jgi:hypothetical protein